MNLNEPKKKNIKTFKKPNINAIITEIFVDDEEKYVDLFFCSAERFALSTAPKTNTSGSPRWRTSDEFSRTTTSASARLVAELSIIVSVAIGAKFKTLWIFLFFFFFEKFNPENKTFFIKHTDNVQQREVLLSIQGDPTHIAKLCRAVLCQLLNDNC